VFYVSVAAYLACLAAWVRYKRKVEWEVLDEDLVRLNMDKANPGKDLHLEVGCVRGSNPFTFVISRYVNVFFLLSYLKRITVGNVEE
jgi:hypothetical protein